MTSRDLCGNYYEKRAMPGSGVCSIPELVGMALGRTCQCLQAAKTCPIPCDQMGGRIPLSPCFNSNGKCLQLQFFSSHWELFLQCPKGDRLDARKAERHMLMHSRNCQTLRSWIQRKGNLKETPPWCTKRLGKLPSTDFFAPVC